MYLVCTESVLMARPCRRPCRFDVRLFRSCCSWLSHAIRWSWYRTSRCSPPYLGYDGEPSTLTWAASSAPPPPIICPSFASSLNSGFSVAHTLPARSRPTKIFVAHYVAMETSAVGCGRACPPLMVAQSASVSVRGWRPHQRGKGPAKGQTDVLRENSRGKFPFSFPAFATPSHDPKPSHTGV